MKIESILPWSQVKKRLQNRNKKDFLSLLSECYKISDEVKYHLTSLVVESDKELEQILKELKREMKEAFWKKDNLGRPTGPDLKEAKKSISKAKKVTTNPRFILDFMIDYVHHGVDFTNEYGDLWETYYDSIEKMFLSIKYFILNNQGSLPVDEIIHRLEDIVEKSEDIGWGFYDTLEDILDDLKESIS